MRCTPPWSRYSTWNSLVSSGASSTKSVAARRVSKVFPVTRLRSRTCTNARRLPGVRCVKSITRYGCPSIMMTWPRRMSVAFISDGPSSRGGKINRVGAGSTGRGKVAQRERVREIPHALSLPPRAARGPLARRAETVAEISQPNVARRRVRKGVVAQQGQHLGRPRQDVPQQRREPLPSPLRVQGREPHLPVEPRHVRGHERRSPVHIARLPAKAVLAPLYAVAATLDDDLGALRRHHAEQPVAVHRADRLDGSQQRILEPTARIREGLHDLAREREQRKQPEHGRDAGDQAAPPPRLRFRGRKLQWQDVLQHAVAEQRHAQHDRQQDEKAVVSRKGDRELSPYHQRAGGMTRTAPSPRRQNQPGDKQL